MRRYGLLFFLLVSLAITTSCSSGQQEAEETKGAEENAQMADEATTESNGGGEVVEVSGDVEERLVKYFKNKYGTRLPQDTTVVVSEFETTDVNNFDKGNFDVNISGRGSQQIPFLISKDRKHLVIGVDGATNIGEFGDAPVPGYKQGEVQYGNRALPVLISDDKKHMIVGELLDSSVDPLAKVMEQISLDNVPVKGDKDAPVTIVEYSDFQCPFCKRGSQMIPVLMDEYGDKISIYYKQLPLPNHNWAKSASIASLCAYKQGNQKFWDFHDSVFYNQGSISSGNAKEKYMEFANNIGLDAKKFESCLDSEETAATVEEEFQEAQQLGVNSTPTFVVDGIIVPGADLEGIKNAIETRLAEQQ